MDMLNDDQPRKKALVDALGGAPDAPLGMPGSAANPNTGFAGGMDAPKLDQPIAAAPAAPSPSKPDYTKTGQFANYGAYASEKMARPWDQMTEKYKIGTVLSHFDPRQGLTPEVIQALNDANIHGAKFSAAGADKLNVENAGGWDRFGSGGIGDVIEGFKTGNGKWGAWADPNLEPETNVEMPQDGRPSFAGSTISPMLQGNAQTGIHDALAQVGGLAGSSRIQELIKALGAA